jgi:hypothetical protein
MTIPENTVKTTVSSREPEALSKELQNGHVPVLETGSNLAERQKTLELFRIKQRFMQRVRYNFFNERGAES